MLKNTSDRSRGESFNWPGISSDQSKQDGVQASWSTCMSQPVSVENQFCEPQMMEENHSYIPRASQASFWGILVFLDSDVCLELYLQNQTWWYSWELRLKRNYISRKYVQISKKHHVTDFGKGALTTELLKVHVRVLQKPVIEKPSTTFGELENSGLSHWQAQRS